MTAGQIMAWGTVVSWLICYFKGPTLLSPHQAGCGHDSRLLVHEKLPFHSELTNLCVVLYHTWQIDGTIWSSYLYPFHTKTESANMPIKQSFKCLHSSMIFLHSLSSAVTKLRINYLWRYSLLVLHGNILETSWYELYICAITTQYE